ATIYALGRLQGVSLVSIPMMIAYHGMMNAFGFVTLGILGWWLVAPVMHVNHYGIPFSRLFGRSRIGADFFQPYTHRGVVVEGLVDCFQNLGHDDFNSLAVDGAIQQFYENPLRYRLVSRTVWKRGFVRLSRLYKLCSSRMQQLDLPINGETGSLEVDSVVVAVDSVADGREAVRAWIRTVKGTSRAVFVAAYSTHVHDGEVYLNIALPLPFGQMTGILRFQNATVGDSEGLILTSESRRGGKRDEGLYIVTRLVKFRLPLNERFTVWVDSDDSSVIRATHQMWVAGKKFLVIDYLIDQIQE
ncbi:MAG: YndJ family transporter, partial [Bacilli bacterium]